MKSLPPSLQAHLDTATTTLAWCWRVTRNDGAAFGFTDHDRDLAFDGTTFDAATGFTASEIKDALGLSVDNLEVSSALKSDRLNEDDLAAGLYDDAAVEIWRVNWSDTDQRALMRAGSITAGCDKQFATCQAKFANAVNFRGFPHMPGNDYILAVARPGEPVTTANR